ncbi:MAG: hypothetical protein WBN04_10575 [Paracoccaceae bacterium]
MKTILLTATVALMSLTSLAPAMAAPAYGDLTIGIDTAHDTFDRRGRGGRSKPRVPGGSGCDDPRDIIEHPECRR